MGVDPVHEVTRYVTSADFTELIGKEAIHEMINIVRSRALDGDPKALFFCLERACPVQRQKTYTRMRYQKKLDTQRDIDEAMSEVLMRTMDWGSERQISLEEADTLTNLLLRKKETMDECLHGDVIELQRKVGMIE